MEKNWEIVRQFVIENEDDFMQYLENVHDIEGSDMDFILDKIEAKLKFCKHPVITKIAKRRGENGRTKKHYLVGGKWFDLTGLAEIIPANAYGDLLSAQALNTRIASAHNPLNNPDILAPRLTEAERALAITVSRQGEQKALDDIDCDERRAKLKAIPLGTYDNI